MSLRKSLRSLVERYLVVPHILRQVRRACRAPRSKPGLLIMGWYGKETAGDKAILASLLQDLDPQAVRILKATYDLDYSRQTLEEIGARAVECVPSTLTGFLHALAHVDVVVIGGGPLMESGHMRDWRIRLSHAKSLGKKVMVYGCGIGPLHSSEAKEQVAGILRLADRITLRDESAVRQAVELGIPRERITLAADPALGLRAACPPLPRPAENYKPSRDSVGGGEGSGVRGMPVRAAPFTPNPSPAPGPSPEGNAGRVRIGVSLRRVSKHYLRGAAPGDALEASLHDAVEQSLQLLLERPRTELVLFPMQMHQSDDDRLLLRHMQARLNRADNVTVIEDVPSPDLLLGHFASFDFLVGMRFHSVVFGLLTHTPLVAIDYDAGGGKVTALMQAMQLSDYVINIAAVTPGRLGQLVQKGFDERVRIQQRIVERLPALQELEKRNATQLQDLLRDPQAARAA